MKDNQVDNKNPIDLQEIYRNVLVLSENLVALAQSGWRRWSRETICRGGKPHQVNASVRNSSPSLKSLFSYCQIIENERVTKEYLQQHLNF